MIERVIVMGAGGHGRSVAEAIVLSGRYRLIGFVDDGAAPGCEIWGYPVLGATAELGSTRELADAAVVAIGNNIVREKLHARVREVGFSLVTVVHPKAFVSPSAVIDDGCTIMAGAVIGTAARLGEGVIVNCGATVDHHCKVESFGHLGVNACMAGGSVLGHGAWIQAGCALGYGVVVERWAILAPGEARVALP